MQCHDRCRGLTAGRLMTSSRAFAAVLCRAGCAPPPHAPVAAQHEGHATDAHGLPWPLACHNLPPACVLDVHIDRRCRQYTPGRSTHRHMPLSSQTGTHPLLPPGPLTGHSTPQQPLAHTHCPLARLSTGTCNKLHRMLPHGCLLHAIVQGPPCSNAQPQQTPTTNLRTCACPCCCCCCRLTHLRM